MVETDMHEGQFPPHRQPAVTSSANPSPPSQGDSPPPRPATEEKCSPAVANGKPVARQTPLVAPEINPTVKLPPRGAVPKSVSSHAGGTGAASNNNAATASCEKEPMPPGQAGPRPTAHSPDVGSMETKTQPTPDPRLEGIPNWVAYMFEGLDLDQFSAGFLLTLHELATPCMEELVIGSVDALERVTASPLPFALAVSKLLEQKLMKAMHASPPDHKEIERLFGDYERCQRRMFAAEKNLLALRSLKVRRLKLDLELASKKGNK